MKKIGLGINREKDPDGIIQKKVTEKLNSTFPDAQILVFENNEGNQKLLDDVEMYFLLGGDGSFLGASRFIHGKKIPILGINIGTLGFLTSVEYNDLDDALEMIKNKEYTIEKRNLLKVNFFSQGRENSFIAMNDVVVSKGSLGRIMKYEIYVDDDYATSFRGDGVILSTPTGSTAYNLSAGGPILYPTLNAISMTAICPHSLGVRNMVFDSKAKIEVKVSGNVESYTLSVDGQRNFNVEHDRSIEIVDSGAFAMVVRLNNYDYFKVLRQKIIYKAQDL